MNEGSVLPARHRLDVDAYYRMYELGILGENPRVELIDGDVIDMAPIGAGHAGMVNRLTEALVLACAGQAVVQVQNPVLLDRFNEPEPDFAVLRRREDFYEGQKPGPGDVLLLIEVADTSLRFDRTVKLGVYARAGVGEYWIVDLKRRVVQAYRRPGAEGYGETATHKGGERLALALMPEVVVDLGVALGVASG